MNKKVFIEPYYRGNEYLVNEPQPSLLITFPVFNTLTSGPKRECFCRPGAYIFPRQILNFDYIKNSL